MANRRTKNKAESQSEDALLAAGELLNGLARQIEASMADNNQAMITLIEAHANIAARLAATSDPDPTIQSELSRMVVAFQEHDALNQRLEHVMEALRETQDLFADEATALDPRTWQALEKRITSHYTTLQERQVHSGQQPTNAVAPSDDIELF